MIRTKHYIKAVAQDFYEQTWLYFDAEPDLDDLAVVALARAVEKTVEETLHKLLD